MAKAKMRRVSRFPVMASVIRLFIKLFRTKMFIMFDHEILNSKTNKWGK